MAIGSLCIDEGQGEHGALYDVSGVVAVKRGNVALGSAEHCLPERIGGTRRVPAIKALSL
jgi:hypothetical protein